MSGIGVCQLEAVKSHLIPKEAQSHWINENHLSIIRPHTQKISAPHWARLVSGNDLPMHIILWLPANAISRNI